MLSDTKKILANSRLSVCHSFFIPLIMGCIILSAIYLVAKQHLINLLIGWVWLAIGFLLYQKYKASSKQIREGLE